jgi:hypothetical protein
MTVKKLFAALIVLTASVGGAHAQAASDSHTPGAAQPYSPYPQHRGGYYQPHGGYYQPAPQQDYYDRRAARRQRQPEQRYQPNEYAYPQPGYSYTYEQPQPYYGNPRSRVPLYYQ